MVEPFEGFSRHIGVTGPGSRTLSFNVVHETNDVKSHIRVLVSPDRLKVFLEYELRRLEAQPTREEIVELLHRVGVRFGVDPEGLDMALLLLRQSGRIGPIEVAAGRAPEPGQDGHIEWRIQPSSEKARYQTDEQGKIDYRETYLIENVLTGQTIAVLHAPTRGVDGVDVNGRDLPSKAGEILSVHVGAHAELDETRTRCRALIDGRVIYQDRTISVSDSYVIHGDVDLTVGNINFVGDIQVNGQVLDDFSVYGRKSVTINGSVGACRVQSMGDVSIHGGVAGKGRAVVKSENGSIQARYLNDVTVEAKGDVVVKNEIVNCTIQTAGAVRIEHGSILGGEICAFRGVEAQTIGSPLGVATRIHTGTSWLKKNPVTEIQQKIDFYDRYINRLERYVAPMRKDTSRLKILSPRQKRLVKTAVEQIRLLRDHREEYLAELETVTTINRSEAVHQVNVYKFLYQGVMVLLGPVNGRIRRRLTGPLSVFQRDDGKGIRIQALQPLASARKEVPAKNSSGKAS
ncbi:MAG: FapA family protein [Planctomycetota bacterium]